MLPAIPERKVPVIVKAAYTVSLERTSGMTFVHCDIHSAWTPASRKALSEDWQTFTQLHRAPIYALHTPGDHKHRKFLALFGFAQSGSFIGPDGEPTDVFIHLGA